MSHVYIYIYIHVYCIYYVIFCLGCRTVILSRFSTGCCWKEVLEASMYIILSSQMFYIRLLPMQVINIRSIRMFSCKASSINHSPREREEKWEEQSLKPLAFLPFTQKTFRKPIPENLWPYPNCDIWIRHKKCWKKSQNYLQNYGWNGINFICFWFFKISDLTICPGSSDPFYIVNYYINWVTTSWTHSTSR